MWASAGGGLTGGVLTGRVLTGGGLTGGGLTGWSLTGGGLTGRCLTGGSLTDGSLAMIDRCIDAVTQRPAVAQPCTAAHGREIVLETFNKTNILRVRDPRAWRALFLPQ